MAWAESIHNTEDIIDSREVIARISDLESCVEDTSLISRYEAGGKFDDLPWSESDCLDESEVNELLTLRALASEGKTFDDWQYGVTLVRESHFTEYAMEFAEEIGAVPDNAYASWPNTCIDWDQAARELRMYYTSVDFDCITYYGR